MIHVIDAESAAKVRFDSPRFGARLLDRRPPGLRTRRGSPRARHFHRCEASPCKAGFSGTRTRPGL